MKGREIGIALAGLVVAMLAAASAASAFKAPMSEGLTIFGDQYTAWDGYNDQSTCHASTAAFTPVDDGSWGKGQHTDAFDAGMMIVVGTTDFDDADGIANVAGPDRYSVSGNAEGLHVTENIRALQTSPTLRQLVQLKNGSASAVTKDIFLTSNLGSDTSTDIRATSSGDTTFTTADRWLVTSDSATTPSDPPVTEVLYGKGSLTDKIAEVVDVPSGSDCMTVRYHVKVPANSSRYLLFFAEMNDPTSNQIAIDAAAKFNPTHLDSKLLTGMSATVQSKILNWDF